MLNSTEQVLDVDRIHPAFPAVMGPYFSPALTERDRRTFISPPLTPSSGKDPCWARCRFKWIPRSLVSIISIGALSPCRITTEHTTFVYPPKKFTHKTVLPNRSISRPGRDIKLFFFFGILSRREAAIDRSTGSSTMFHLVA